MASPVHGFWGRVAAAAFCAALLCGGPAWGESAADADAKATAEAKAHAKAGSELVRKERFREALEEFQKAMALKRTRGAVGSVASTLKMLGRYDDALDLYEELLREFKELPPAFLAKVNAEMAELRAMMGTVVLAGDAPSEGAVFIDDRLRGKLPLAAPLRVARGIRSIRVEKQGFEPITATVEVGAGQESRVELRATIRQGHLVVREKHNWPLRVEVDGKDVGISPWNGLVEPGTHAVRLHGFMGQEALLRCEVPEPRPGEPPVALESGVKMQSPRVKAEVKLYDRTEVVLGAEGVDALLRVESTPRTAILMIDYGQVGLTPWEGRLPLGDHVIEVSADGYATAKQTVKLERLNDRQLGVVLQPLTKTEPKVPGPGRAATIVSGYGVGALGLGLGAVTGLLARQALVDIETRCGGRQCTLAEEANLNEAKTLATVSTAGFVVGGAFVLIGTVALFVTRPKDTAVRARLGLSGLVVEGSF
jgi:hypothetical protein